MLQLAMAGDMMCPHWGVVNGKWSRTVDEMGDKQCDVEMEEVLLIMKISGGNSGDVEVEFQIMKKFSDDVENPVKFQ